MRFCFNKLQTIPWNEKNSNDVYVYPNPFTGSSFQIHFENIPIGLYKYDIINTLGQVVDHGNINLNTTNSTLTTNNTLQSGIYVLRLVDENNNKYSVKLLIKLLAQSCFKDIVKKLFQKNPVNITSISIS